MRDDTRLCGAHSVPRATGAALLVLLAACSSSGDGHKSFKSMTCGEYARLAAADDAVTNGSLDVALNYMNSTPVDPKGGAGDAAAFGDQIVASCETATPGTRIVSLRGRIVSVFLAQHPEDRP